MLVTIICLAEWRQLMLEARLETIFDCMDFSNNGQISADEMVSPRRNTHHYTVLVLTHINSSDAIILLHCFLSLCHSSEA
jgi:hypothetical protein